MLTFQEIKQRPPAASPESQTELALAVERLAALERAVYLLLPASARPRGRFVLLTQPRCGTWMLGHMLMQHPAVQFDGDEPFNPKSRGSVERDLPRLWPLWSDKTCGFVQHLCHAPPQLGRILFKDPGVSFICLRRRNRLAQYVSQQIARATGVWKRLAGEEIPERPRIHIDVAACRLQIADWEKEYSLWLRMTKNQRSQEISYEELVGQTADVSRRICNFLRIEHVDLKPQTVKLARPLSESVTNFEELRTAFAGTGWLVNA